MPRTLTSLEGSRSERRSLRVRRSYRRDADGVGVFRVRGKREATPLNIRRTSDSGVRHSAARTQARCGITRASGRIVYGVRASEDRKVKGTKRVTACPSCDGHKQRYSRTCNKCAGARLSASGFKGGITHGHASNRGATPEYSCWLQMRQRCKNPRSPEYANYGGRGIAVCAEWDASFESFFSQVGARPSKAHTLDRINNNGNYEQANIRWATRAEQQLNRRVCLGIRRVDADGREEPISLLQAASFLALSYSALRTNLVKAGILKPEARQFRRRHAAA